MKFLYSLQWPFISIFNASSEPMFFNIAKLSLKVQAILLRQELCSIKK